MSQSQSKNDEPTLEQLESLQKDHIEFLENYFCDIDVKGVPILTCINYKTVQVANSLGLRELIRGNADDQT